MEKNPLNSFKTEKPMMKQKLIIIYSFFNYFYKETLSLSSGNLGLYLNTISFLKLAKKKVKR